MKISSLNFRLLTEYIRDMERSLTSSQAPLCFPRWLVTVLLFVNSRGPILLDASDSGYLSIFFSVSLSFATDFVVWSPPFVSRGQLLSGLVSVNFRRWHYNWVALCVDSYGTLCYSQLYGNGIKPFSSLTIRWLATRRSCSTFPMSDFPKLFLQLADQ